MANAKAALESLQVAFTQYKQSKNLLDKSLKAVSKNERNITSKMFSISSALTDINKFHTMWVTKAGITEEELSSDQHNFNTSWLESLWEEVDNYQMQVDDLLLEMKRTETVKDDPQVHVLKEELDSLKLDIKSRVDTLLCALDPGSKKLSRPSLEMYGEILAGVQTCLKDDLNGAVKEIMSLDPDNMRTHCNEFEHYKRVIQPKILQVQMQIADQLSITSEESSEAPSTHAPKHRIEMEKSKAPTFSGKTIDYPEFKRGWKKVAGVCWEDSNQVEQIKFKVDSETRRIISRCNTMAEVWTALDTEFAQEQEVINAVEEELSKLLNLNCTVAEYIVKLRNHLPNLEAALEAVDGLDHLQSPDRVNVLISRFDDRTLHDWDYFRSKSSGSTYCRFFSFLVDRYDACKSSVARSKSSSSLGEHVFHSMNKQNGTSECHRCMKWTAQDKVYTCPACGRGTAINDNIHHCLEHCGAYMAMSLNQRAECLEKSNWCPIHLVGSHKYSDCNMKNDLRYICGVDGCSKHHHKSLHGCSSPFLANVLSTTKPPGHLDDILMSVQSIPAVGGSLNCLFDNAATCSLITEAAAKSLNLVGEKIMMDISTVTGTKTIDSALYHVPIIDSKNVKHVIIAHQVSASSLGIHKS